MTYNKPEVVRLASAVTAIQGQLSKETIPHDNMVGSTKTAPAAYEADE